METARVARNEVTEICRLSTRDLSVLGDFSAPRRGRPRQISDAP
jgi:hypothetical protein